MKEQYEGVQIELITFMSSDVIVSSPAVPTPGDNQVED